MAVFRNIAVVSTRALFFISALLWFGVGILVLARSFDLGPVNPAIANVLGAAMLVAATMLVFLAWRVLAGNRLIDGLALVVAVLNVAATLMDEVGAYDIAYLVFSAVLLGSLVFALVASRGAALGPRGHDSESRRSA